MSGEFGTIIQIGDILVSEDVVLDFFECDYAECKGECCIEGDGGAPLEESEIESLEKGYREYSVLMSAEGRAAVSEKGFFEIDRDGDIVTPLCKGKPDCAFSFRGSDGGCLCAIERCALAKPSSCSLYPIRITRLSGGGTALNVHHWKICLPAYRKGKADGVRVYQFLKKPLTDRFGEEFYEALEATAKHLLQDS